MKSKNTFKKFITCMLIAAIAITGISLESVTTANAAAKYEQLEKGCTITMKVGETKRFLMTDEDGKDLVVNTAWKTSDKNIVSIETDFADENCITEYIQFTANAEGTAIIGGRSAADYAIDVYNGFQREHCPEDVPVKQDPHHILVQEQAVEDQQDPVRKQQDRRCRKKTSHFTSPFILPPTGTGCSPWRGYWPSGGGHTGGKYILFVFLMFCHTNGTSFFR